MARDLAIAPGTCSTASASVTAGFKCAPEIGPNVRMRATNAAPVVIVFAMRERVVGYFNEVPPRMVLTVSKKSSGLSE